MTSIRNWRIAGLLLFMAIVLAPTWFSGFTFDDIFHHQVLATDQQWWLHLFRFLDGDEETTRRLIFHYGLPWWTDQKLQINFFRPVSALTHWLDHKLWPDHAGLQHLHSVAWYLVCCTAAFLLYRKILVQHALLAGALFALDFQHFMSASWLANRNALIATTFGIFAVMAHLYATRRSDLRFTYLAALLLTLSLLSGEIGLGGVGYLIAISLVLDKRPVQQRVAAVAPLLIVVLVWIVAYMQAGFGARASGYYLSPLADGWHYPLALIERVGQLALVFVSGLPYFIFSAHAAVLIGSLILLAILTPTLARQVRANPVTLTCLVGAVIALLPIANAGVDERNLLFCSLGGHAVLAGLIGEAWQQRQQHGRLRLLFKPAVPLILLHLVFAPIAYLVAALSLSNAAFDPYRPARMIPLASDQDAVFIRSPYAIQIPMLMSQRRFLKLPVPHRSIALVALDETANVEALDDHTVRVTLQRTKPLRDDSLLFRNFRAAPLHAGDTIELSAMHIEIASVDADGVPDVFTARFTKPLRDYQWLTWTGKEFSSLAPPVGNAPTHNAIGN